MDYLSSPWTGLSDAANFVGSVCSLQYLGSPHTPKLFTIYQKFKFNWQPGFYLITLWLNSGNFQSIRVSGDLRKVRCLEWRLWDKNCCRKYKLSLREILLVWAKHKPPGVYGHFIYSTPWGRKSGPFPCLRSSEQASAFCVLKSSWQARRLVEWGMEQTLGKGHVWGGDDGREKTSKDSDTLQAQGRPLRYTYCTNANTHRNVPMIMTQIVSHCINQPYLIYKSHLWLFLQNFWVNKNAHPPSLLRDGLQGKSGWAPCRAHAMSGGTSLHWSRRNSCCVATNTFFSLIFLVSRILTQVWGLILKPAKVLGWMIMTDICGTPNRNGIIHYCGISFFF